MPIARRLITTATGVLSTKLVAKCLHESVWEDKHRVSPGELVVALLM